MLPYRSEEFGQVVGCKEECHPKKRGESHMNMTTPYHTSIGPILLDCVLTGWKLCIALLANCAVIGWWEKGLQK